MTDYKNTEKEQAKDAASAAAGHVRSAGDEASQAASHFGKSLKVSDNMDTSRNGKDSVDRAVEKTEGTLTGVVENVKSTISSFFGGSSVPKDRSTADKADDTLQNAKDRASATASDVKDTTRSAYSDAKDRTAEAYDNTKDRVGGAYQATKDRTAEVYDNAKQQVGGAYQATKDKANETTEEARKRAEKAKKQAGDTAQDVQDRAGNTYQSLKDSARETADAAEDRAGSTYDTAAEYATAAKDNVVGAAKYVGDRLTAPVAGEDETDAEAAARRTADKALDTKEHAKEQSKGFFGSIKQAFSGSSKDSHPRAGVDAPSGGEVKDSAKDAAGKAKDYTAAKGSELVDSAKDAAGKTRDYVAGSAQSAMDHTRDTAQAARDKVAETGDKMSKYVKNAAASVQPEALSYDDNLKGHGLPPTNTADLLAQQAAADAAHSMRREAEEGRVIGSDDLMAKSTLADIDETLVDEREAAEMAGTHATHR